MNYLIILGYYLTHQYQFSKNLYNIYTNTCNFDTTYTILTQLHFRTFYPLSVKVHKIPSTGNPAMFDLCPEPPCNQTKIIKAGYMILFPLHNLLFLFSPGCRNFQGQIGFFCPSLFLFYPEFYNDSVKQIHISADCFIESEEECQMKIIKTIPLKLFQIG